MMNEFIERRPKAMGRVWVMSDLQQSNPVSARECMTVAVRDFAALKLECEQIWYLGDAVEGGNMNHVNEMTAMHVELLEPLGVPLRYVNGNHDFDLFQYKVAAGAEEGLKVVTPFWEAVRKVKGWRTTQRLEDFYFWERWGNVDVLFLSDHCESGEGKWISTHGEVRRGKECYPHGAEAWGKLRDEIAGKEGDVIIAGHGGLPGGNRAGELMKQFLPLPRNVKLVLYGHAHIGDRHWVKEHVYRKIAYVDHTNVPQVDVASLENKRGDAVRSVVLERFGDGSMAMLFRDHSHGRWAEMFVIGGNR